MRYQHTRYAHHVKRLHTKSTQIEIIYLADRNYFFLEASRQIVATRVIPLPQSGAEPSPLATQKKRLPGDLDPV
jgi:hypothetical protein